MTDVAAADVAEVLGTAGVTHVVALNTTEGGISVAASYADLAKLTDFTNITLLDDSAAINDNLDALLTNVDVTTINSTENQIAINLTAAQATVVPNTDKLVATDWISVVDTSAAINTNLVSLLANEKIDAIDSNQNGIAINLTAAQATTPNLTKLSADDLVKVSVVAGDNLSALTNIDKVDTGSTLVIGAAASSAAMVSFAADNTWFFAANVGGSDAADELTYYDATTSAVTTITLTGVATVALDSAGVFNLTLETPLV